MRYEIITDDYHKKSDKEEFLVRQIKQRINNLENQAKTYSNMCKKNSALGNKKIAKTYFNESERIYEKEIPNWKELLNSYNRAKENFKEIRIQAAKKGKPIEEIEKVDNILHSNLRNVVQSFL